jgi:Flp pilus assembly protein TadD
LHYYSLQSHYNLANLYIETHKYEEALKELHVCVKLQPSNAWVHNNLGVVFQQREYYEEAEEEFLRALNLEPANKTFENNLAMIRQHMRKKPVRALGAPIPGHS